MPSKLKSPMLLFASRLFRTGVGLGSIALAVLAFAYLKAMRVEPATTPPSEIPLTVETISASPVEVARIWTGYGTSRAMNAVNISAEVRGRITERPDEIEAGQAIRAGDLIVQIDATDYEQAVRSAEQRVAALEAQIEGIDVRRIRLSQRIELAQEEVSVEEKNLERARELVVRGAGNSTDVENRLAAFNRAQRLLTALEQEVDLLPIERTQLTAQFELERANLRVAEENLVRTTIRSPIDGMLQDVFADTGELLNVGTPVARVVDPARLEVPLRLPLSATETLVMGDRVDLAPDGPIEAGWAGAVSRIAPEADAGTRSMTAFVEVVQDLEPAFRESRPAPVAGDPVLLPGQFLVGRVFTGAREPRIVVPRGAVDGDTLYIARSITEQGNGVDDLVERAVPIEVRVLHHIEASFPELHPTETQWAVLATGIGEGDRVIISNIDELFSGLRVATRRVGDAP